MPHLAISRLRADWAAQSMSWAVASTTSGSTSPAPDRSGPEVAS